VRIGEDPWEGPPTKFQFSDALITRRHAESMVNLKDSVNQGMDIFGRTVWKLEEYLNLVEDQVVEWSTYFSSLKQCFIHLDEEEPDTICWAKNKQMGCYTVKLGYQVIAEESIVDVVKWWWSSTWKWKAPEKIRILFWFSMEKKF
jgi:hypothetical protein